MKTFLASLLGAAMTEVHLKKFAKTLTACFGTLPYKVTLFFVQTFAKVIDPHCRIWARNSFALGYLEPGYSDLDITLYSGTANPRTFALIKTLATLRKMWPLLGEVNYYNDGKIQQLLLVANFFEMNRDPMLQKKMNSQRQPTTVEAAVFLLRQLERDVRQLSKFPDKRVKKWKFHTEQIIETFPSLGLSKSFFDQTKVKDSVLTLILELCEVRNPVFFRESRQALEFYLELVETDFKFYKLSPSGFSSNWFFCFALPHLTVDQVWPQKLNSVQIAFLEGQKKWEQCGMLSQTIDDSSKNSFIKHLENMDQVIRKLSGQRKFEMIQPEI